MTVAGYIFAIAGAWIVLSTVVAIPLGRLMRDRQPKPEWTNLQIGRPDVPLPDRAWLAQVGIDAEATR